jgi:hypothetical protein
VIRYGIAPNSTIGFESTSWPLENENDGPWRKRKTKKLIRMITSVTTGKRSVGRLSRRGIKARKGIRRTAERPSYDRAVLDHDGNNVEAVCHRPG